MTLDVAGRNVGGWPAEGRKGSPKDLFDGLECRGEECHDTDLKIWR